MSYLVKKVTHKSSFFHSDEISDAERRRLHRLIHDTMDYQLQITEIEKIRNDYLYTYFTLKKREYGDCVVRELIHCAPRADVEYIKKYNLNWRTVKRIKYGQGVFFSTEAQHAYLHSKWLEDKDPVFIIFDVLVKVTRNVTHNTDAYPKFSTDCYKTNNGLGYLKFDDFTYYPKYVIHYKTSKPITTGVCEKICKSHLQYEDWTVHLADDYFPLCRTIDICTEYDSFYLTRP